MLRATFGPKASKQQAHRASAIERLLSNAVAEWAQPCKFAAAAGPFAGVLDELHVLTYSSYHNAETSTPSPYLLTGA